MTETTGPGTAADYQLCYVEEGGWAWFANVPPGEVWGDDWNDAPHTCNAGTPYECEGQEFVKVAFDGDLELVDSWDMAIASRPTLVANQRHHYVSAQDCNEGRAPWLIQPSYGLPQYPKPVVEISGGCRLDIFRTIVEHAGGNVYMRSAD